MDKLWYTQTMKYFLNEVLFVKRNEKSNYEKKTWKKLRYILLSKISQSEKDTLSCQLYDILENKTTEIIKGSEIVIG